MAPTTTGYLFNPGIEVQEQTFEPSGVAKMELLAASEARAQRIAIALKHMRGEWFLDANAGTDWFGQVLGKATDLARRAELRRRILGVPGVRDIRSMALEVDPKTRRMSGTIEALDVTGETLVIPVQEVV